jgi:hypothetical protein
MSLRCPQKKEWGGLGCYVSIDAFEIGRHGFLSRERKASKSCGLGSREAYQIFVEASSLH